MSFSCGHVSSQLHFVSHIIFRSKEFGTDTDVEFDPLDGRLERRLFEGTLQRNVTLMVLSAIGLQHLPGWSHVPQYFGR